MHMRQVYEPVLEPLQPTTSRGWSARINGVDLPELLELELRSPRFGSLRYGLSMLGYDTWNFHEVGGGGAVIAPYSVLDNELFVGVVQQVRPNQFGEVWNLPRGFLDNGELHAAAAVRELREETGLLAHAFLLPGEPVNPNSAFFVTAPGEGVRFYAAQVPAERARRDVLGPGQITLPLTAQEEGISTLRFIPWQQAMSLADMFTVAGVGRLLAYLRASDHLGGGR
jgi:ADP-ribose pyrophosphatase YjhB (NUDIX family)